MRGHTEELVLDEKRLDLVEHGMRDATEQVEAFEHHHVGWEKFACEFEDSVQAAIYTFLTRVKKHVAKCLQQKELLDNYTVEIKELCTKTTL